MTPFSASRDYRALRPLAFGLLIVVVALMAATASRAEDRGATPPAQQFEALLKQYDAPRGRFLQDPRRGKIAADAFLNLARDYPDDPASIKALNWVISHIIYTPETEQALRLLIRDHSKSEQLIGVCKELDLLYGGTFKPVEVFFRAAIELNPNPEVQAWACLGLARLLKRDKEQVEQDRVQHEAARHGRAVPIVLMPSATDADLARMAAESADLYQRIIDHYGEIPGDHGPIGPVAKRERNGLQTVSVGMSAPEIEGFDLDGRRFKLSDYRGKVVVLMFWGQRSRSGEVMYPADKSLVKRMEPKPFAYLGVNSGDSPEVLKSLRPDDDIPWRSWIDGDLAHGKIVERWDIRRWPTVFVLDFQGKIVMKGSSMATVGYVVDDLLKDLDPEERP